MKRLTALILVLTCLILTASPALAASGFRDVPADAYYANAVSWAVNHNPVITNGTSATQFSPNAYCTRAQAVTFLWRAMGCPNSVMQYCPFTDVKRNSWYDKAVMWANEKGITTGTSAARFSPDTRCTRAQIVTFLWRAMGRPGSSAGSPFRDVDAGSYYAAAVRWANQKGITTGTSATKFSPDAYCTRAQIVTFLYRLNPSPRPDMAPYLTATYAFSSSGITYDIARIDWKCDVDALDTYWCTMNWYSESGGRYSGIADGSGYAGFQNVGGTHKVIMSIWATGRGKPSVEYVKSGGYSGSFSGEGTGQQVLVDYPWKAGVWYTMQIEARQENGKTVYYQFVTPENGSTELICAISFPKANLGFTWLCAFQEDWKYNNFYRSCYLRNAMTRTMGQTYWSTNNSYYVSNTAGKAEGTSNVRYNCDFAAVNNMLWMRSGGGDYSTSCRVSLPAWLTVSG